MNRTEFLEAVRSYVESDPEAAAHVADYVRAGLQAALRDTQQRAVDMETALVVLMDKRYPGAEEIVLEKIEKWRGKTVFRWDWLIKAKAARALAKPQ